MDSIPYLMVSQKIEAPLALGVMRDVTVFVCINLIDHRAIGIATSKRDALDAMSDNTERLHGKTFTLDGFEVSGN
ncbi:MAG: hypothetical protein L6Q71_12835 [Planctomycetes bacterium]|nr:hypothetical protein [Planctomycetota bacterium]NUQ35163.1 hypothetical protein [Planctomycetaceae bacterium]